MRVKVPMVQVGDGSSRCSSKIKSGGGTGEVYHTHPYRLGCQNFDYLKMRLHFVD